MRRTEIFWLGLEALPREVRATEWRSWVKAPSDVGLLSRTWKTRRYQRAESQHPLFELLGLSSKTFGTFQKSQKSPKMLLFR